MMKHVSPSQIKTFRSCPRKWWFSRNTERPAESSAQSFGTEVHEHLEAWVVKGSPFPRTPTGIVAHKMSKMVTKSPGLKAEVETRWTPEGWDIPVVCRIDLIEKDRCTDYKTTKEWRTLPDAKALRKDPQAILYPASQGQTKFRYVVGRTKPLKNGYQEPREVSVNYTPEELQGLLDDLKVEVDAMRVESVKENPWEVPKDTTGCFQYGRCPYSSKCWYADQRGVEALGADILVSLE